MNDEFDDGMFAIARGRRVAPVWSGPSLPRSQTQVQRLVAPGGGPLNIAKYTARHDEFGPGRGEAPPPSRRQ